MAAGWRTGSSELEQVVEPWVTEAKGLLFDDLMRSLTTRSEHWTVWKNVERSRSGLGDVDSAAPRSDWQTLEHGVAIWADRQGLGPCFRCEHISGTLTLIAVPTVLPEVLEVDLVSSLPFRGSQLFAAASLSALSIETRGVRHLRPGASGLFGLLTTGMAFGGEPNWAAIHGRGIRSDLMIDEDGMLEAAHSLPSPFQHLAVRLGHGAISGEWPRAAAVAFIAEACGRGLVHPEEFSRRVTNKMARHRPCRLTEDLRRNGRLVPPARDRWIEILQATHRRL